MNIDFDYFYLVRSGETIVSRTIRVTGKSPGLRQIISIGPHQLLADEAREGGSEDEGPHPYEYLLASLGACTNMTLRMYANRKGWPLKQVETTLSHSKSYAADCEHCEQPAAMIDQHRQVNRAFRRTVGRTTEEPVGDTNRCPVHRTLTSKLEIHSALETGGQS